MSQITIHYSLSRLFMSNLLLIESKCLRNIPIRNNSNAPKKKTASSVYRSMNIFDRKTKLLQKERSAQREDYYLAEFIKEEVGWRTADRVFDIKRTFKNAVELGASRGYVSRHFLPDSVEKVTLCDTSQTHLDKAIVGDDVKFEKVVMDEESFDMWPILMQFLRSNAAYITLPVAAIVGVIGYNLESLLSDRYTPYNKPVQDQRLDRLIEEDELKDPTNVQKLKYKENVFGKNVAPSLQKN